MSITCPSVWSDHTASVVLVTSVTPSTVYCVGIKDQLSRDIMAFRIMNFLKDFNQENYCPFKASEKMLFSDIPCTQSAIKELKGVLAMSNIISSAIVVSRTAEFIGRFIDGKTASKVVTDENASILYDAAGFEKFSKKDLNGNLATPHNDVELKNVTKTQLAEELFTEYLNKEIKVVETEKATKEAKVRIESTFHKIISRLEAGEVLKCSELMTEYDTTKATIASMTSNMRSEKYMKDRPTVPCLSGKLGGEQVFFLEAFRPENLDEKKIPTAKVKGDGTPRAKGLKTKVRELLLEGPQTMDQLLEATSSEKKLISDCLAYLKNPKYCGSEGALVITRNAETKAYEATLAIVDDPETAS